jgi:hypothetical protein
MRIVSIQLFDLGPGFGHTERFAMMHTQIFGIELQFHVAGSLEQESSEVESKSLQVCVWP